MESQLEPLVKTEGQVEEAQEVEAQEQPAKEAKSVSFEEYNKMKVDFDKLKKSYEESQHTIKTQKTEEMRRREDWQKLSTHWESEAKSYEDKYKRLQENLVYDKKITAVKDAARNQGIRKEALEDIEMLDLSDIQLETTSTGRFNVLGTDDYISRLKVTKPHWFSTSPTNINTSIPTANGPKAVSMKDVYAAEKKVKESQGDPVAINEYKKVVLQFKKQTRSV